MELNLLDDLDARLYVGPEDQIVLSFNTRLPVRMTGVKFCEDTHLFKVSFEDVADTEIKGESELNCPMNELITGKILGQSYCAVGIFDNEQLVEASYLPLYHSRSEFGTEARV